MATRRDLIRPTPEPPSIDLLLELDRLVSVSGGKLHLVYSGIYGPQINQLRQHNERDGLSEPLWIDLSTLQQISVDYGPFVVAAAVSVQPLSKVLTRILDSLDLRIVLKHPHVKDITISRNKRGDENEFRVTLADRIEADDHRQMSELAPRQTREMRRGQLRRFLDKFFRQAARDPALGRNSKHDE